MSLTPPRIILTMFSGATRRPIRRVCWGRPSTSSSSVPAGDKWICGVRQRKKKTMRVCACTGVRPLLPVAPLTTHPGVRPTRWTRKLFWCLRQRTCIFIRTAGGRDKKKKKTTKALIIMLCRLSRGCFRSSTCRPLGPGENLLPHRFGIWECPPSVYHPYLWGSLWAAGTVYYDGVQTSVRLERFDSRLRLHLALRRWKSLAKLFDIPNVAARKEVTRRKNHNKRLR